MNFPPKFEPSFTLVEVLVVIAILGILSSSVLIAINPNVRGAQARDAVRKQDLGVVYNALVAYLVDHGTVPYAGPDGAAGSSENFWLKDLESDYLKKVPKDPRQAGIIGNLAMSFGVVSDRLNFLKDKNKGDVASVSLPPNTNTSYTMPVLVISYYPTKDGVNMDSTETGITGPISATRANVNTIVNNSMSAIEQASKFQGYKNVTAQPALDYSVYDTKEFFVNIPRGAPADANAFFPDYMTILNNVNICDYVDNHGVKEVWFNGYHYGKIVPVESNMAGPHGDISNSNRIDDMPTCSKTYIMYNSNYARCCDLMHVVGHQMEALMGFVDSVTWDKFVGPWKNYDTTGNTEADFNRCGWTHNPPNMGISAAYIYWNTRSVWTDCEDFRIDGKGTKTFINCSRWDCDETKFHIWRLQNMPGRNNGLNFSNWWDFYADLDGALAAGKKLVYDISAPSVPTNLTSLNIFANKLTLSWGASTDDFGIAGYQIKRDGVVVGSTSSTSFDDFTVSANTTYQYKVIAADTSGNASGDSSPLSVTTTNSSVTDPSRPVLDSTSYKVGGNSAKDYSFFHSIGNGPNRYLVVGVSIRTASSNSVASVKYDGTNLTRLGFKPYGVNGDLRTELWGLKSPATGIGQISVSLTKQPTGNEGGTVAGATSWSFVDQTNPTGAYAGAASFSTTPTVAVPSTNQSVVVDVGVLPSASLLANVNCGQTIAWNRWSNGDTAAMGSYVNATSNVFNSTSMCWNSHNEAWSMSGISLNLGLTPPIIIIPDPTPSSSPSPTTSPDPQAEVGCPQSIGNYCYVASADLNSFTLWAWLENDEDLQIWNKPGATCNLTPPDLRYYNFCMKY